MRQHILKNISKLKFDKRPVSTSSVVAFFLSRCVHCATKIKQDDVEIGKTERKAHSSLNYKMEKEITEKFSWIQKQAPSFGISGENVRVIKEPSDFYDTMKVMIGHARKRIVIASLYLGTGSLEKELVQCIEEACERAVASGNTEFEVHILLDYNRGSRGGDCSSRTMLLPLIENYRDSVQVYLYHTPDLRGLLKKYLPERINEAIGLNHMKIYLTDDDFIISGANLSDSYFTNRQDRYIQFRGCKSMAEYLCDIVKATACFSFHLQDNNDTTYPQHAPHPYEDTDNGHAYKEFARKCVTDVNKYWTLSPDNNGCDNSSSDCDTCLTPLIQMGPFKIHDDEYVTEQLFRKAEADDKIVLASGYFNLTSQYLDTVLNESKAEFEIVTASPEANGWHGATGLSHYVPAVYTQIAHDFYKEVCRTCQQGRITLHEYQRPYWSFHCKGLWYYLPHSTLPVLTLIGSPNYGYRSVYRDLECQVAVVTTNKSLQEQLKEERDRLSTCLHPVTEETFEKPDRAVPLFARLFRGILKHFA